MLRLSLILAGVLANVFAYGAEPCTGLADLQRQLQVSVSSGASSIAGCRSWASVLKRLLAGNRTSGRKLQGDAPLNLAEAQANLETAKRSPEVQAKLERARGETQHEELLLAYEAAIYDEEGFYGARDLRIQQLNERQK